MRVGAAQAYADLLSKYVAAQGLAAAQKMLIIGEGVESWTQGLMGWAEMDEDIGASKGESSSPSQPPPAEPSIATPVATPAAPDEEKLKVAFRYERLKRINDGATDRESSPSSSTSSQPFVHPFDLSTRISPRVLQKAKSEGRLVVHDVAEDADEEEHSNTYEEVWGLVRSTVERWRQSSSTGEEDMNSSLPARILLPSLGSPSWSVPPGRSHAGEAYRLLLRIKGLLRQTAWPSASSSASVMQPPMPIIAISSPSTWLLLPSPIGGAAADVAHRLSSLADGALTLSSFSSDPRTRSLSDSTSIPSTSSPSPTLFTGALRVLRTPALGSLRGPSIRASALRGMGGGEESGGGAGSSENALGFRVRRKGVKVEVMGRDLVAGGEPSGGGGDRKPERKTQSGEGGKVKQAGAEGAGKSKATVVPQAASPSVSVGIEASPAPKQSTAAAAGPATTPQQPAAAPARAPLKGLAALRARGLEAQQGQETKPSPKAQHGGPHGSHDW